MSIEVFRATWPIVDQDAKVSEAKSAARVQFEQMARDQGVRLIGDIAWALHGPMLVAVASAIAPPETRRQPRQRADRKAVSGRTDEIVELRHQGYSYSQIAEIMGCNKSSIAKIAQRAAAA